MMMFVTKTGSLPVDLKAYIDAELERILNEAKAVRPSGLSCAGNAAVTGIAGQKAQFRNTWERYRNGQKEIVVLN